MASSESSNDNRDTKTAVDGAASGQDSKLNTSSGSSRDQELSMGGSQGTKAEARKASSTSDPSSSSREGGYGADSGYGEASRSSSSSPRESGSGNPDMNDGSDVDSLDSRHPSGSSQSS